jgi:integrase
LLDANPAARLKKRGVEEVGHRVLDDAEIATFWKRIVLSPVSRPVGLALRLALLTAARANEVAGARKAEFQNLDGTDSVWVIPSERVKNKREHLLPLSPLAVETIKTALDLTSPDDEFLFPSRLGRREAIDRHTLSMAMARFGKSLKGPEAKTWQKTCRRRTTCVAAPPPAWRRWGFQRNQGPRAKPRRIPARSGIEALQ